MIKSIDLSANGKLLLTGEYLVLTGARALALPVRFGQTMHIEPARDYHIHWESKEKGRRWFSCELETEALEIVSASDPAVAKRLVAILRSAKKINPGFPDRIAGFDVSVEANYPLNWGLGSSSTLVAMIAEWARVDKYVLSRMISQGSGYDIACTDRDSLFFYQLNDGKQSIREANPGKALLYNTCFTYLGKKQETSVEVDAFLQGRNYKSDDTDRISELSEIICEADDPLSLCSLVDEHEEILSRILKKEPIGNRFPGFPGSVKSLGAWGGDFAMFVSQMKNQDIKSWLTQSGFKDIFTYDELKVLS